MSRPFAPALTLLFSLGAGVAVLAEPMPAPSEGNSLWGMGTTGILCYQESCPWRGVFRINPDGSRERPLSASDMSEPPPLEASEADRARIEAAFTYDRCVIVEARHKGGTMIVARILGDC